MTIYCRSCNVELDINWKHQNSTSAYWIDRDGKYHVKRDCDFINEEGLDNEDINR